MESHNLSIVTFAENIRQQMLLNTPPLIRRRRLLPLFRTYTDVFYGCEAVSWAMKNLKVTKKESQDNEECNEFLSETESCSLFQKLMDAGLLVNVITQEQFKSDKSLFRFSSDNVDAEKLIRSVAVGYRLYICAQEPKSNLFQKVCALGQFVSCECLKSSDIVAWLVDNAVASSRESAVSLCRDMVNLDVLKPVDSDIQEFTDGKEFYLFAIDYKQTPLTVHKFLTCDIALPKESFDGSTLRSTRIHLRQSSDQLEESNQFQPTNKVLTNRKKGISTSSDDSGFDDNALNISPSNSYESLLNSDGSMTRAALLHPSAPFIKKTLWIYPDPVGYGFVIRGTGPCFVKIVDPDSPAGKAGLKADQYIIFVNRKDVTSFHHKHIEDFILNGPKYLKITVLQHKDKIDDNSNDEKTLKNSDSFPSSKASVTPLRQRSCPPLPSAQPWIKNKVPVSYSPLGVHHARRVLSQ